MVNRRDRDGNKYEDKYFRGDLVDQQFTKIKDGYQASRVIKDEISRQALREVLPWTRSGLENAGSSNPTLNVSVNDITQQRLEVRTINDMELSYSTSSHHTK